jgi:hypothetical protein
MLSDWMFQHPIQTLQYHTTSPAEWVSAVFISSLPAAVSLGAWPIIPDPNTDTFVQHGDDISTLSLSSRRHLATAICRSILICDPKFDYYMWTVSYTGVPYTVIVYEYCINCWYQVASCDGMKGGEKKCLQRFGRETWRKEDFGKSRNRRWSEINTGLKTRGMIWPILDSSGWGQGQMAGSCDHGSEQPGSIKCGEILD